MALKNEFFTVSKIGQTPDEKAPDGSEIRLLPRMTRGSLCECLLPVGKTSLPVAHKHIEEIWYVLSGEGEIWRKNPETEKIDYLCSGVSLTILPETAFQFRNTGDAPLRILIVTMPPWPGPDEAITVDGVWSAKV